MQRSSKNGARMGIASTVRIADVALPTIAGSNGLEVRLTEGTVVRGCAVEELAALVPALRS